MNKTNIFKGFVIFSLLVIFLSGCTEMPLVSDNDDLKGNKTQERSEVTTLSMDVDPSFLTEQDAKNMATMVSEMRDQHSVKTRAVNLDVNGQIANTDHFKATCYLTNEQGENAVLGRFELEWKIKVDSKTKKITLQGARTRNVNVTWLKGGAHNTLTGDKWKVCGFSGGTVKNIELNKYNAQGQIAGKERREVISFMKADLKGESVEDNIKDFPIASDYQKVEIGQRKHPLLKFHFRPLGVLLKVEIKVDRNVSTDEKFYFNTTALEPEGVFFIQKAGGGKFDNDILSKRWQYNPPKNEKFLKKDFDGNIDLDKYGIILDVRKGLEVDRCDEKTHRKLGKFYRWYLWGMPVHKTGGVETNIGALNGGYIIKQIGGKGPFTSKYSYVNDEGKLRRITGVMAKPEPYPHFQFLNMLNRMAPHALKAERTWWEDDRVDKTTKGRFKKEFTTGFNRFFSYADAQKADFYPAGYRLPTFDEMTILFPNPKNRPNDLIWWTTNNGSFSDPNYGYEEWVTLYAPLHKDESNRLFLCDNWDMANNNAYQHLRDSTQVRNIKGFTSYYYNPRGKGFIYAIRFERNVIYGNRLRCAYRYEMKNLEEGFKNLSQTECQMIVTSRWIGDAPLTVEDISNEQWWKNGEQYNIVRKLPAQGQYKGTGLAGTGDSGSYYTLGLYGSKLQNMTKVFSIWKGGSFQRKTFGIPRALIFPITNAMMCNEKGKEYGDKYGEEGTKHASGKNYPIPDYQKKGKPAGYGDSY